MFEVIFLIGLALVWIIFASVQDLRSREVANWLNFSLIIFALGFRFFFSLFERGDFAFFYQGLIGLGIFLLLGNFLYYGRMFAGGDAKLMIALGAILPFSESFYTNVMLFVWFFVIFLFVGAVYGMLWSLVLMLRNFDSWKKEFGRQFSKNKKLIYVIMFLGLILMLVGIFETFVFFFGILIFILPYFYLYAKSVDEVCMVKQIKVGKLREGDWLYKDVKVGKNLIKAKWEGLSKKNIALIQKSKKDVLIREGIPFIPVFLIAFLIFISGYFMGFF
jgi:Flp pilus assembly protein protease CpaA